MNDPWTAARAADETIITFPRPTDLMTMNGRYHWRTRSRLARAWRFAACQAAGLLGTRAHRAHDPSFVLVELPVLDRRRRDPHNYSPTVKHTIDGLVDAGIWTDDTPEWVTTIEPRLVVDRPPKGYPQTVRVLIWPRSRPLPVHAFQNLEVQ